MCSWCFCWAHGRERFEGMVGSEGDKVSVGSPAKDRTQGDLRP